MRASRVDVARILLALRYPSCPFVSACIAIIAIQSVRPTTDAERTVQDVIHKFKFQRIDSLDVISVSDFPDSDLLKHGFVIHFPEGPMYYRAETAEIKKQFFAAFQQACVLHGDLVDQQIETLQRAYTSTEA
jgi:hypothetical protein